MISEGPFTLRIEYPLFPVNRSSITPMKTTVQFHFRTESGGFLFAIKFHADSLNGLILKLPSVLFTPIPSARLAVSQACEYRAADDILTAPVAFRHADILKASTSGPKCE